MKKLIFLLLLAAGCWNLISAKIVVNLSGSMPIGIYYRVAKASIARGDIVAVCLPNLIARTGFHAGYLSRGRCPTSHTTPVLKAVIALPDDLVTLNPYRICVKQHCYWAPRLNFDTVHHRVPRSMTSGEYRSRGYWLYGSGHPLLSWDSRYFGAVSIQNILGVYRNISHFFSDNFIPTLPARLPFAKGNLNGSFLAMRA